MTRLITTMLSASILCFLSACGSDDATTPPPPSPVAMVPAPEAATAPAAAAGVAPQQVTLSPWTPPVPEAATSELCSLDAISGQGAIDSMFIASVAQGMTFEGWASTADMSNPGSVAIILDGASDFQITGTTGIARSDVSQAYGGTLSNAGFKIELPELKIPPGRYAILVMGMGSKPFLCSTKTTLTVS